MSKIDEALGRKDLSEAEVKEIRDECDADVSRPGKFEGEAIYVPYFWAAAQNGLQDEVWGDYDMFKVSETDRNIFPELAKVDVVVLTENEQGFVVEGSPEDVALEEARSAAEDDERNETLREQHYCGDEGEPRVQQKICPCGADANECAEYATHLAQSTGNVLHDEEV